MRFAERMTRITPSPSSMAGQRVRELRASGRDVIGLTAGEPDMDTPAHIKEAAIRAIRDGQTKYTDVGGTPELKAAIVEKFRRENRLEYRPNEIVVATGAKQVLFNALLCMVQRGDEVIIPAPHWVSYPDMVRFAGAEPVAVACTRENGFKLTPQYLQRAITPRTRCLMLNSPSNPTGASYTTAELRALADVLVNHPDIWIVTDDIYEHLLYDGRTFHTIAVIAPELKDRTLTVNGVSKAYAMTGWRLGYAGGPASLISNMVKLQSQSTSNACSISQAAAVAALTGPQDFIASSREIFQSRRDMLVGWINETPGLHCDSPDGAFYVYASCAGLIGKRTPGGTKLRTDMDVVSHFLESQGVAVIQGDAYGMSPYFRMSIATSEVVIRNAYERIHRACDELITENEFG